jgi:dihydroflavonol-4-reductase
MKVFLTGGTGFIGGEVARRLRARGDDVVALVRTPGKATALSAIGCTLVQGDVADAGAVRRGLDGADAAIHGAAIYEVGILPSRRPAMYEANVTGTRTVLSAALDAGTPKVVYVSTIAAFGDTKGAVVDETYEHPGRYTSYYDETKHLAHQEARRQIAAGLPLVVVQPGAVYGPGDHSVVGDLVHKLVKGRLPFVPFPAMGLNAVHRDDVADGILLVRPRRRDHDPRRRREGRREGVRPQGAEVRDAGAARQGGGAVRARGGAVDGLPAEHARADHDERRRDVLGDRREGARRARLRAPLP